MLNISIPICMQNMEIMPTMNRKTTFYDFLVQLEGFVSKFLESNAKIEGFASIERMVKISVCW